MIEESVLNEWFFNLPASWQEEITGIHLPEDATDADYEKFDDAVADWWDELTNDEKVRIYKTENN